MPVIRIERFDDARLAEYRNVSDREFLRRRNRFVAEGRLVVERLIGMGGITAGGVRAGAAKAGLKSCATLSATLSGTLSATDDANTDDANTGNETGNAGVDANGGVVSVLVN